MSLAFSNQTLYSHNVETSWWLKMGLMGAVSYLALVFTILARGVALWRDRSSPLVGALALGASSAVLGLVVAEQIASYTGVDVRVSIVVAVLIGLFGSPGTRTERQARHPHTLGTRAHAPHPSPGTTLGR